jgi:protein-ribulosamine 3-kinase
MPFVRDKTKIGELLSEKLETGADVTDIRPAGAGCINATYIFKLGGSDYFLKENSSVDLPGMFEKERDGLTELAKCNHVYIPKPVLVYETEKEQYLVMEYLVQTAANTRYYELLGRGLAELHNIKNEAFGFGDDNYIGSVPQSNMRSKTWPDFFSMQRLHPLVKWSYDQELLSKTHVKSFENLYGKLEEVFPPEQPCLLHGDLWKGNVMNTTKGPALYDPAVYYGHREMDLAMTRLFGGFEESFYKTYEAYYPLEKGHRYRTDICNLYPLLVHVKLFGPGYLQDVFSIIKQF